LNPIRFPMKILIPKIHLLQKSKKQELKLQPKPQKYKTFYN